MDWPDFDFPRDLRLDVEDIAQRGVLISRRSGSVKSRVGLAASLYFVGGHLAARRRAMLDVLKLYLENYGEGITHYQRADERRMRRYQGSGLPEGYDTAPDASAEDSIFLFMQGFDPKNDDDPSHALFMGLGTGTADPRSALSGVKMHFPMRCLEAPDELFEFIQRAADSLGALHGTCGLAALSTPGTDISTDAYWLPWLLSYPALDYDDMGGFRVEADNAASLSPRTTNWLTILGTCHAEAIDTGRFAADGVETAEYSDGRIFRASQGPVLGNAATGGIPEGYRTVAREVAPIRFEGYRFGIIKAPKSMDLSQDERRKLTLDWLRRFDG